jgi:hypothetical protein
MILMQGIIERTVCFPEERETVSLFKQPVPEESVKFIYDAENSKMLPSGIPTFKEWWRSMGKFQEGDRVFLNDNKLTGRSEDWEDRYLKYYSNKWSIPDLPKSGIYQVEPLKDEVWREKEKVERIRTVIKYHPGGEYWTWDGDLVERKNRTSFIVKSEHDDFLINYDNISRNDLKKLEFYIHTRIGREEYLFNIPTIQKLMEVKKQEMSSEDDFIRLVLSDSNFDPEKHFDLGVELVDWWKTKNKWKRFLNCDDYKAYRMITKELTKRKF